MGIIKNWKLTKKQQNIFDYICLFYSNNLFTPTYRDVGERFNISSRAAYDHVKLITKKGYLIMKRGHFIPYNISISFRKNKKPVRLENGSIKKA